MATKAQGKAPQKTVASHLSLNKIYEALRERGFITTAVKVDDAMKKAGYESLVLPASTRSGFMTLYKMDDVQAYMDKVAPVRVNHDSPPSSSDNAGLVLAMRAMRIEVTALKDAIHQLMTSVIEAREHAESVDNLVHDLMGQSANNHSTIAAALDEIDGRLVAMQAMEVDEKTTLDNVLDILTQPASTGAPPDVGIDSILEAHDDVHR